MWRLSDERALVLTTDVMTPLVDDARMWGRIVAANALSDVYAMGGQPILALNIVGWPRDTLPFDLLGDVLLGAQEIADRAGCLIVGGHTIDDHEPKYGLAVVGEVHPDRLLTNAGLQAGQALVLTKPLGTGIVTTALKNGRAGAALVDAACAQMIRLNDDAARIALAAGATGATDVTGFGLLGHLGRMAAESRVDVLLEVSSIPLLRGARELAEDGCVPGGTQRNLASIIERVDASGHDDVIVMLLADAQTSGGLVFGVAENDVPRVLQALRDTGHTAARIGSAVAAREGSSGGLIRLLA